MIRIFLISTQVFYALCLFPWYFAFAISLWALDGGLNFSNGLFFVVTILYPVAVIFCSIFAWVCRIKKKRLAIILNCIPLLWIIGYPVLLLVLN